MANTLEIAALPPESAEARDLSAIRATESPRLNPPPTPLASRLIHLSVLGVWILLLVAPFGLHGIWVWSSGLVYIAYDTMLLVFTFWQTLVLIRPAPPPQPGGATVTVGVIIAARNEALVLPVTLKALLEQTEPPDRILIADNGSTDDTASILGALYGLKSPAMGAIETGHPHIHWLRLPESGKARALNLALPQMDTDVFVTVDADTLLERGAIAAVRRAFASEAHLVATTGVLTPVCAPTASGQIFQWFQTYEYVRNFLARFAWMRLNSLLLISGAFAGFRRVAVIEVGGFDPDCLVEDYELIHRLKRHSALNGLSWTTRVLGGARALTEAPSTLPAFIRQRSRWFGGFLQTQYWYRDMVGDSRYGALGLAMLPVKAIDTLQPLYGLAAFALLISFIVRGQFGTLLPVGGVILAKIMIDFSFQLWAIHLYRRWMGDRTSVHYGQAFIASIIEPFSFQLLRHAGAAWGWVLFLTGRQTWGSQKRLGALAANP